VENTAVGDQALINNTADSNTATGFKSLFSNTIGNHNTATGDQALFSNTEAGDNTATGYHALFSNTIGSGNTATGEQALDSNTTGNLNTAIGTHALLRSTTGRFNVAIGESAGLDVFTANDVICIGSDVRGADVSNSCFIGNIFGQTSVGGVAVFINQFGQLGTVTSSARFKEDVKPIDKTSESLFSLKPVSFRYKKEIDPAGISQLGLVAEEVEKVNPDLVVRDKEGKPYSVRYDQVNAMLLNEFLKEHKEFLQEKNKAQEQSNAIARLEKQVAALTAGLQKVTAQVEASKVSTQVALKAE
jgi:hypothetical protein